MVQSSRKQNILFAGIVILVHLFFFILACYYKRIYMGDSFEYIYEAVNIKDARFFYSGNPAMPKLPEYMTQRQPLYPLFLCIVYLFSINNWVVLLLQNILSVINIVYLRRILLAIGHKPSYDWLLIILIVGCPSQFINANTIAPDILLQTCTLLYAGNAWVLLGRGEPRAALAMSVALVAGMLVKPVLYPFVLLHVFILLIAWRLITGKVLVLASAAALPVAALLLYNFWNYERTGKFHFSSNQAFNAIYYYYPFINSREGADSAGRFLSKERARLAAFPDYKVRYDEANARGMKLLKEHAAAYLPFHLGHAARILVEPGKAEIDLFTGKLTYGGLYGKNAGGFYATMKNQGIAGLRSYIAANNSVLVVILVFLVNCLRLAGFARFLFSAAIPVRIRLFCAVFIIYFALAAGPIANTRYFLPVAPLMAGAAVIALASTGRKIWLW